MIKSIEGYSYKINEHIGKGYSSTVHKGIKDATGQQISIKVIQMSKLEDPINQMLLQYQVSALKSLTNSKNVLHLFDVYATKNNTYIITQLMQGDLHSLLKQKKQFIYYEAVQILKQIINGYIDIYKSGYLHRDIKPANIFYKKNQYKIGDFGFAIPSLQMIQHRNYNVGSPVYMPPQALKQNLYSVSCDTWAIGVIFYQLLKGLVPWRAISEQKLYQKIINQPLSQLTLGLPEAARTFLSKILHLDSSQRMTPQQLQMWPEKLFAVQIRQMSPSPGQVRNGMQKYALQQVRNLGQTQNRQLRDHSRTKSYSNTNNSNNLPDTKINMIGYQQTLLKPYNNTSNLLFPSPSNAKAKLGPFNVSNNNNASKIKFLSNNFSNNTNQQQNLNEQSKDKSLNYAFQTKPIDFCANCMIYYIQFIHRVIKFISHPTELPLKSLQFSLIKFLFKQIQMVRKLTFIQNIDSTSFELGIQNIPNWKSFILSKQGQEKFINQLNLLKQKYKMFCILPKDQFIMEIYKEQIIDGIKKISLFLQSQNNYSQKYVVALDYLITFYQVWQLKQKFLNRSFKQFIEIINVDKIMEGNPYNVQKQHLLQLQKKMKSLGLMDTYSKNENKQKQGKLSGIYQYQSNDMDMVVANQRNNLLKINTQKNIMIRY